MNYIKASEAPVQATNAIKIHDKIDFEGMRNAGQLAAQTLDMITSYVVPGVTTDELDILCAEFVDKHGAISAPLNYNGFPKSICTSINHVVCHGIPGPKKLREGDIINIDVTVILKGWFGDTSRMFHVGKPNVKAARLVDITYECLMRGIAQVKPGNTIGDIGHAISQYARSQRCGVVEVFCGHGLGRIFHDSPNVLHYGTPGEGAVLKEGMFFTIEPMINLGTKEVKVLSDDWTAVTRDKSLSAQFEHSMGVTSDGVEIFTQSPEGHTKPPYAK
ncbi:MAG: type I methionyl aminopeptidase [Kordiimonadaceae bacterium]|jgi:methionyl aminopeptidase|nr:type I methionyl aminopeptidase [Kordiimonadaceae bacterium]MBT6031901.1 type I methionyl aminopeptidase [Kordiimonadaceae bacterium]